MYEEQIPLHKTETIPIEVQAGDEWELVCYECSFRARFIHDRNNGANRLEILDFGDPQARHSGNQGYPTVHTQLDHGLANKIRDEEAWLTPELRQKLSVILQGLD